MDMTHTLRIPASLVGPLFHGLIGHHERVTIGGCEYTGFAIARRRPDSYEWDASPDAVEYYLAPPGEAIMRQVTVTRPDGKEGDWIATW